MQTSTHTQPFWIYDVDEDDEGCARFYVNTDTRFGSDKAEQLAKMLEAAPALLDALRALLNYRSATVALTRDEAEAQARAAIAAATGEDV